MSRCIRILGRRSASSHKLGWPESEMDIELVRFAGSPLSVTASQPISSAMRSGSNARFTLSYRDVEEMLAEPGLDSPTRACAAGF